MKKNFLFLLVLVLGVALTGCGGGGGATDAPVPSVPVFQPVAFVGALQNNGAAVASPSRQLAVANLTAHLIDVTTGQSLTSVACGLGGTYTLNYTFPSAIRTAIHIRFNGLTVGKRFLGNVQPVETAATVSNVVVDERTTARAQVIEQTNDSRLLDQPFVPTTTAAPATTTAFTEAEKALESLANDVLTGVAAVITAIQTAIQTAVTTAMTAGTVTATPIPTVPTTDIAKVTTAAAKIPTIVSISLDDKPVYANGQSVSGVSTSNKTPTFVVNFSHSLTGIASFATFRVTETLATGATITRYISSFHHYSGDSSILNWGDVFTALPTSISGNSFTFSVKSKAAGGKLELAQNATYKIEVVDFYGLSYTEGSTTYNLLVPGGLAGYFNTAYF